MPSEVFKSRELSKPIAVNGSQVLRHFGKTLCISLNICKNVAASVCFSEVLQSHSFHFS